MTTFTDFTWHAALSGRWIARLGGLLMILFLLAFALGEGPPNPLTMTTRERLYGLGMLALFGGLGVAWFRPLWGSALTLAGWAMLWALAGRAPFDLPLSLPAALAVLHMLCWARLRGPAPAALARPGWVMAVLLGPLPVFVLLCANEMFGQPPLMASMRQPAAQLAGEWSGTLTSNSGQPLSKESQLFLRIAPDGTATCAVDAKQYTGALTPNRSWFGRLMHWRTDYRIAGTNGDSGGSRVSLLADDHNGNLDGHVTITGSDGAKSYRLLLHRR